MSEITSNKYHIVAVLNCCCVRLFMLLHSLECAFSFFVVCQCHPQSAWKYNVAASACGWTTNGHSGDVQSAACSRSLLSISECWCRCASLRNARVASERIWETIQKGMQCRATESLQSKGEDEYHVEPISVSIPMACHVTHAGGHTRNCLSLAVYGSAGSVRAVSQSLKLNSLQSCAATWYSHCTVHQYSSNYPGNHICLDLT